MTNVKKILAILLALCIVCGGTSVLAAGQTVTYTSPTSRYQAQKFSHPDAGVGEIDGIIEYDSGENDRGQNYSWSAQGYGDYMYVGTCYAAIYATINIMAPSRAALMWKCLKRASMRFTMVRFIWGI